MHLDDAENGEINLSTQDAFDIPGCCKRLQSEVSFVPAEDMRPHRIVKTGQNTPISMTYLSVAVFYLTDFHVLDEARQTSL